LLRVKKGLVVLTKIDLLDDPDWLDLVRETSVSFSRPPFWRGRPSLPCSAVTGLGLEELKSELARLVADVEPRSSSGPFRLPVDRVFTMKGFGTVVTGTCISGRLRSATRRRSILPVTEPKCEGYRCTIAKCRRFNPGNARDQSAEPRPGLIERGDVVSTPGAMVSSYMVDVHMEHLSSALGL